MPLRLLTVAWTTAILSIAAVAPVAGAGVDIGTVLRKADFADIKISPDGDYFAAILPLQDRSGLVILRRADNQVAGSFSTGKNTYVEDFSWVNPGRILISTAQKFGSLDMPQYNGDLFAVNADGKGADILVGQDVNEMSAGSHVISKRTEAVAAFLVDDLPADPNNVVISTTTFGNDPYSRAEMMDVRSGKRHQVARSPVRNARFVTDNSGAVRFASGYDTTGGYKLYYRQGRNSEWELVNDEGASGHSEIALGFSADNGTAYLEVEQADGPDKIVAMDVATRARTDVLRDPVADPALILRKPGTGIPVGAMYLVDKPHTAFFDPASDEARLYRSLESAFAGLTPRITSSTADGRTMLVEVSGDRQADEYYLFNPANKSASLLLDTRAWIDPRKEGERRPFSMKARDGMELHGYLTIPAGKEARGLPMVVLPHGGPFGEYDTWRRDDDAQLLAAAGYAVLQVNYRGSGGRGRSFQQAGGREWGGAMQDDVTDATRWAIGQGIADKNRICIYGGSYGGYAALMGAAKDPDLYRCAVGYVGVYDLPMMYARGDIQESGSGRTFLKEWLGAREDIAERSPA